MLAATKRTEVIPRIHRAGYLTLNLAIAENMRKFGYSAQQLTAELIEYGYWPYKLATETAEIIPFEVNESPEYEKDFIYSRSGGGT
jgi:hypothetical protein